MSSFEIKKILVPIDFSGTGEKVLKQASVLSKKTKAAITLINVLEGPIGDMGSSKTGVTILNRVKYEGAVMNWAKENMEVYKKILLKNGASRVDYIIEKGSPYKKILETAKKINADLILMGTHGVSGVREFVVGSNTFRVVSEALCPVLSMQKHTKKAGFKEILLPFRDKAHSREKVDYAISIAKIYGATIHILGISYDKAASAVRKIQLEADQIEKIIAKQEVKCTKEVVTGNYAAKMIFSHAKKKRSDLIVIMSDMDKVSITEYIIGPVVQQIINHSSIPVLSIHPNINSENMVGSGDWSFWG
jgi:nucleotide-binding universal stress UspA family protein